MGRGILRISGLLTTNRGPALYHFSEIARSFEDSCEGTNSIASRTAGRSFVHPAFCKNGARTVCSVPAPLFLRHFRKKPIQSTKFFLCSLYQKTVSWRIRLRFVNMSFSAYPDESSLWDGPAPVHRRLLCRHHLHALMPGHRQPAPCRTGE